MATAAQAVIAANTFTCTFPTQRSIFFSKRIQKVNHLTVRASTEETDCNVEECAPDKEVGKVSVEWLAVEKTKVSGTFPPRKRGWTGYVEKDTAGQTNIYSVEPAVYVAESGISSGSAGSSANGAENTAAIAAGLALISVAAASSILLQVGKNPTPVQKLESSAPEPSQIQVESEVQLEPSANRVSNIS
ncbi:uncharacterized protein Pyn_10774 [Prunus yedoensis var. nudiflora]|uniref:Protein MAINTENANCE OF PSII UNDER HIGH LIGHT 1 n=1 Tax=Prunus yedoensis var. nudiflora TaxID=2094558 RepID=A0A314YJ15_PRUYE|nr:uncharacterized protein Pyn_10774 [Prunus yedoensis var. nudiflora]